MNPNPDGNFLHTVTPLPTVAKIKMTCTKNAGLRLRGLPLQRNTGPDSADFFVHAYEHMRYNYLKSVLYGEVNPFPCCTTKPFALASTLHRSKSPSFARCLDADATPKEVGMFKIRSKTGAK